MACALSQTRCRFSERLYANACSSWSHTLKKSEVCNSLEPPSGVSANHRLTAPYAVNMDALKNICPTKGEATPCIIVHHHIQILPALKKDCKIGRVGDMLFQSCPMTIMLAGLWIGRFRCVIAPVSSLPIWPLQTMMFREDSLDMRTLPQQHRNEMQDLWCSPCTAHRHLPIAMFF